MQARQGQRQRLAHGGCGLLGVAGVVEATEAFIRRTVQGQQGKNWLRTVSAAGMAIYKWSTSELRWTWQNWNSVEVELDK
jgi:hypothetical protein